MRVVESGNDRDGRTLAHLYVGDRWLYRDLVASGVAWHSLANFHLQQGHLSLAKNMGTLPPHLDPLKPQATPRYFPCKTDCDQMVSLGMVLRANLHAGINPPPKREATTTVW